MHQGTLPAPHTGQLHSSSVTHRRDLRRHGLFKKLGYAIVLVLSRIGRGVAVVHVEHEGVGALLEEMLADF